MLNPPLLSTDTLPGVFLLASSLDPVDEVFVVENALTTAFVAQLKTIVPQTGAKLTTIPHTDVPHDVWIQDTMEFGVLCVKEGSKTRQVPAPLLGIRALHDGIETAPLDKRMAEHVQSRADLRPIQPAKPRPHTRWIDWFGNLEVTPALKNHPHGRVLYGRQKELAMHPDVLAFLQNQKLQWPPIEVDVSFLTIGHVDEVVNFVPMPSAPGFRVLLPSPSKAREILQKLVDDKRGDTPVFAGKGKSETTAAKLLSEVAKSDENTRIEKALGDIRLQLMRELSISPDTFADLPALFHDGLAVLPNAVNSLVMNNHIVIPAQCGPVNGGVDMFDQAIRDALAPCHLTLHFVDIWEPYHMRSGEIHCGTNALRRLMHPA